MTINEHITEFAGLPVVEFDPYADPPADASAAAWRVSTDYDGEELFNLRFNTLVNAEWAAGIRALVIGEWGESYEDGPPLDALVAAAGRLTGLRALFIGEMVYEECEISWIKHGDLGPLVRAYPDLEVLTVRGSDDLVVPAFAHERLTSLTFEAGGLPAEIVRAIGESDLPALTHLELWLGTDNYGGDATVADLAGVFAGTRLPALRSLGLRDAEIADDVAAGLAGAPVVARLERLDLSLGILGDAGVSALLAGQPLTHLRELDLHHHYISEPLQQRLREELEEAGVTVNLDDVQDEEGGERYVAVGE
jgi:hypothetical protein